MASHQQQYAAPIRNGGPFFVALAACVREIPGRRAAQRLGASAAKLLFAQ
jgi:hypothetical protein